VKKTEKQSNLINDRREDEITNVKENTKNNQPLPQPKDIEEIEY